MPNNIKESRLWNEPWSNLSPNAQLEALRETVLEIAEALRQEPSFDLKHSLEDKVSNSELRAWREAEQADIKEDLEDLEEKLINKIDLIENSLIKDIVGFKNKIDSIPKFEFSLYGGNEIEQTQKALADLKNHINQTFNKLKSVPK